MDQNEDKLRQVERHLRGGRRFEERKENLVKRKKRGYGPPSRMRELDDEYDDDSFAGGSNSARAPGRPEQTNAAVVAEPNARVSSVARTEVHVLTEDGDERVARLSPAVLAAGGVVVGDDITLDKNDRVTARHARRTTLERRAPGHQHRTRLLAANVDVGLVVLAPRAGGTLSLGFLDRAIAALEAGGVEPCVVVTKVDLGTDEQRAALHDLLRPWQRAGVGVHLVGSPTGEGIDALRAVLAGRVAVLLGHSGVGKSTLVNALDPNAGLVTGAVREADGRGRHTTTASQLVPFVDGGALVDTPGVRMLVPDVSDVDALARAIPELAPFLGACRFSDCAHVGEPGCAVAEAASEDEAVASALRRLQRLIDSSSEG